MITIKGKYNSANVMIDSLDETTRSQIQGFVNNPSFGQSYIAIMPDCHAGAGRILSRSKAKETLDVDYFKEDMKQAGVYTTTANASTLDESPDAYKDMQVILDNIKETVDIVEMVKPVYNFKSGGE